MMQRTHARDDCLFTLLIATSLAAACGEAETRVEPVEVRDSAGIRIVMNNAPASTEWWTVDAEPTVTVGGNEDDSTHTLFRVTGGVVLADERIVVTHGPAPMIRWYDGAGNYLFGAGRPGGGPGEFGSGEGAWISTLWDIGGDSPDPAISAFSEQPVAWPSGDFLIYGSNQRYELAAYDTTGALSMLIRRSTPRQVLTAEMIVAYKGDAMSRAPDDPATRRRWEDELNSAPYPDSLPAYRRIRVDQTGTLWINAYGMPGADSTTWSVFDADGRGLSDIVLPEAWQILDIGQDYILALTRDEPDIERVQKHRLHRR